MKSIITQQTQKLIEIAKRSGISYLALFGSFARNQGTPESDVDLAVRFGTPVTLLDLAKVQLEMQDLLGRKVDLIPLDSAYSFVREAIAQDAIVLYTAEQDAQQQPIR